MEPFDVAVTVAGLAALGSAVVPRILRDRTLSFPVVYLLLGVGVFLLPLGISPPDPLEFGALFERMAELGVIISLMGAGLKLDRPLGRRSWSSTWRLLSVTMPASIAVAALLGWWLGGLAPAAAMLFAAAAAPTDPVLAADVQVRRPYEGHEDEVRFALTSEAGLNDGLAFPFTHAAVAMAIAGAHPTGWLAEWIAVDLVYRLGAGLAGGYLIGGLIAQALFRLLERGLLDDVGGFMALAATLLTYGLTELVGGYGFLAVFVAALRIRHHPGSHRYHESLHRFNEEAERLLVAALLILFGGAIDAGVLGALTWQLAAVGLLFLLVVRPLAAWPALSGASGTRSQHALIAFFGIRGMGSIYYMAYGLNAAEFTHAPQVWALMAFVVTCSVLLHGLTSRPLMRWARLSD